MLNSQPPAICQNKVESKGSAIQKIENDAKLTPEFRAYNLLRLASGYLAGEDTSVAGTYFRPMGRAPWQIRRLTWEDSLVAWVDQISSEERSTKTKEVKQKLNPQSKSDNSVMADSAIRKALGQLEKSSQTFVKLNMFFVASRLFQKMGNIRESRKYNKVLEEAFQSCEGNTPVDEEQIRTAVSILNSMSFGVIPVQIPDFKPRDDSWVRQQPLSCTERDFRESEKLRLRAIAMVDRLPAGNHVRRKAHRDLALWYVQLDKTDLAEKEKQVLFQLVGSKDDSILYPYAADCGSLVWWVAPRICGACGMG